MGANLRGGFRHRTKPRAEKIDPRTNAPPAIMIRLTPCRRPREMWGETMSTDQQAQHIHDRATRGEPISAEERSQLDQWYARMDAEEGALLSRGQPHDLGA